MDQNKTPLDIPTIAENLEHIPTYASDGAAGADIRAGIQAEWHLQPGEAKLVPTGLRFAIPEGYEIQVRPRSGLALKHGVTVLNSPGTIDADYRGELGIILINHGKEPFIIKPGMRIAQIVVMPVVKGMWIARETLPETIRGSGGFGHTGVH
jgi:dUTP pyrophosphatase